MRPRKQRPSGPGLIDLHIFHHNAVQIDGVPFTRHAVLLRRDTGERVRDPAGGELSGYFFSRDDGCAQIPGFVARRILTARQARYASRALMRARLPHFDPPRIGQFREYIRTRVRFVFCRASGLYWQPFHGHFVDARGRYLTDPINGGDMVFSQAQAIAMRGEMAARGDRRFGGLYAPLVLAAQIEASGLPFGCLDVAPIDFDDDEFLGLDDVDDAGLPRDLLVIRIALRSGGVIVIG